MSTNKYIAVLPGFPGFYHSILDGLIDREVEQEMEGCGEPGEPYHRPPKTWEEVDKYANYQAARLAICKGWVKAFSGESGLDLEMESMSSPKEYNFTTDRLFVQFDQSVLDKLKSVIDSPEFRKILQKHFTSRSGFISFYPSFPEEDEWQKPAEEWDHNQLMCLIEAWVEIECDGMEAMEDHCYDLPCVYEAAQHLWDTAESSVN